jgi:phage gpG-like protein
MIQGKVTDKTNLPKPMQIRELVRKCIAKLTFKLLAKVKQDKLTGQVLNRRTGRLSRSVNADFKDDGMTGVVGTNVEYAAVHELGLEVVIKSHMRMMKQAFGRPVEERLVQVRQHTVNFPEKSFLRSALKDMGPEIRDALDQVGLEISKL